MATYPIANWVARATNSDESGSSTKNGDWYQWGNIEASSAGNIHAYTVWTSPRIVQLRAKEINTFKPSKLLTYQGHFPTHIPTAGKHLVIDTDVAVVAVDETSPFARAAVVAHFLVPSGFQDPYQSPDIPPYTDLFMEHEFYWSPTTTPAMGGNWRWYKTWDKLLQPGQGFRHMHVDLNQTFMERFGLNGGKAQQVWDDPQTVIDYITATTIEVNPGHLVTQATPWTLSDFVAEPKTYNFADWASPYNGGGNPIEVIT